MATVPAQLESRHPSSAATSRSRTIAYWITTAIIATEMAVGAAWDLLQTPFVRNVLAHLGYPAYFLIFMGVWKVPGVMTLLVPKFPRLKEWAYAGLIFTYTGAAFSHLAVGEVRSALDPLVFTGLTFASWALRPPSRRNFVPAGAPAQGGRALAQSGRV